MTGERVHEFARTLRRRRWPLTGRRHAVAGLARDGSPLAAQELTRTVLYLFPRERIAATIYEALADLRRQDSIDAVCEEWAGSLKGRWKNDPNDALGRLLKERDRIASGGPRLRAMTALHVGRHEALADGDTEIAKALLGIAAHPATSGQNSEINL